MTRTPSPVGGADATTVETGQERAGVADRRPADVADPYDDALVMGRQPVVHPPGGE